MALRIYVCCFLFFVAFRGAAQEVIIPFRLTEHNNIIIKVLVNKQDSLDLMFQIAMKDAAISPMRKHSIAHIQFNADNVSDGNKVSVGDIACENVRFFNNELSGQESDGKIGLCLFKGKPFKIDYSKNEFVVYDKMPALDGLQTIPLVYKNDEAIFVNISNVINGTQYLHPFFLQSGYEGCLLYDNAFADTNKLADKLVITSEKKLKDAAGQIVVIRQGILPEMQLGNAVLKDVPVGFFAGARQASNSFFGADLLRRFDWIFDADRKFAYIKPSKYFSLAYLNKQ